MNFWCQVCGGLVDVIGLHPREVRPCTCKQKMRERDAKIAELDRRVKDLEDRRKGG